MAHSHPPSSRVLAAAAVTAGASVVDIVASRAGRSLFLQADAVHLVAHLGIYVVLLLPARDPRHKEREDHRTIAVLTMVLVIAALIGVESFQELSRHGGSASPAVMTISLVGFGANLFSAWLFQRPARAHFSFRVAMAHEVSDASLTLVGLAGAGAIALFGWRWVDPALSIAIAAWLAFWATSLLVRRHRHGPSLWDDVVG